MHPQPIDDPVAREWRDSAANWKRREPDLEAGMWPVTHRLIAALQLQPGCRVLDVGSGLGDPALSIALAVQHTGSVVGIDPAPGMIDACRERAAVLGLPNAQFVVGSLNDLPETPESFDAASARFSIMFAPEPAELLSQVRRLLRPGGRIAVSVWASPAVNPLFAIPQAALKNVLDPHNAPDPDMPSPLRFAADGKLETLLRDAGFADVLVESVRLYQFARDANEYWSFLTEIVPPFRKKSAALSPEQREHVRAAVIQAVQEYTTGGVIRIPATALLGVGVK